MAGDAGGLAADLLARAADDAAAARALLPVRDVSDAIVGFHGQQAVEKALKAVLALHRVEFPFTHDVALLMDLCGDAGLVLPDHLREVDLLTPFGVGLRYATVEDAGLVDRETAVHWAEAAVSWARGRLEERR